MTKLPATATKKAVSRRGLRASVEIVSSQPATTALVSRTIDIATPLILELPTAPSINDCFGEHGGGGGRRGRHDTKVYKDWKGHALWRLKMQRPARIATPCVVFGSVDRMSNAADIDNRIKPTLDILKTAGVYSDDSLVTGVAFVWAPTKNGMTRLAIVPATSLRAIFHPANETGATGGWFLEPLSEEEAA